MERIVSAECSVLNGASLSHLHAKLREKSQKGGGRKIAIQAGGEAAFSGSDRTGAYGLAAPVIPALVQASPHSNTGGDTRPSAEERLGVSGVVL